MVPFVIAVGGFEGPEKLPDRAALPGVREDGSKGLEDFLGGVDMFTDEFDARLAGLRALVLLCVTLAGGMFPSA
jgi:hypothetical protein